ncbi:helix-hairpin-helix domain-containing protein [Diaphorobacter aerolatus]|uniref:Helix-hairpin-helix domain-containing protein n=1 Tax=Diaphorobacter aerolatus TaxID=1288495 RepID=A0A7H0GQ26_9BURK|nr:helix-hairpin-helix domain-containing protein [Diaphorobacter aerolatus]
MQRWLISLAAMLSTTLALAAVDINKATEAELDGIKGIGPATTRLIVDERKTAPFADWTDLTRRVKGIGAKRAAKLSAEGLMVNGQSYEVTAQAAPKSGKAAAAKSAKADAPAAKAQKP